VKLFSELFVVFFTFTSPSLDNLEAVKAEITPVSYARALHCITEDARTLAAVKALERGDFTTVGRCMTESHVSLRDQYEVPILVGRWCCVV
jgi:galactokinase